MPPDEAADRARTVHADGDRAVRPLRPTTPGTTTLQIQIKTFLMATVVLVPDSAGLSDL
jgi:hypothetical protein